MELETVFLVEIFIVGFVVMSVGGMVFEDTEVNVLK
jgi:hypothetical protein